MGQAVLLCEQKTATKTSPVASRKRPACWQRVDGAGWLAASQHWCFLELSIGKCSLLELRDKGFEISPGGKEGRNKTVVSTNILNKKMRLRACDLTRNSCDLVSSSSLRQSLWTVQGRCVQLSPVLPLLGIQGACLMTFLSARFTRHSP